MLGTYLFSLVINAPAPAKSALYVSAATIPSTTIGAVSGLVTLEDMFAQAPILGVLVVVVWVFLKFIRDSDERRTQANELSDKERTTRELAAENIRAEVLRHIGADCHEVQRESNETMKEMRDHMMKDAEVRGMTVKVLERLQARLDQS